ncbi:MAG: Rrf2 family transcriptional regulator [Nitrospirae bacterium]|nr:Rrf2 family transcriptional regulator [Nitrospirota bacterium]
MLKLTKKVDYALLALSFLSQQEEGQVVNIREISEAYQIPTEILAKVLQRLSKKGILQSHHAPKGGYSLKKPAKNVSILDVINAIDGSVGILSCSDGHDKTCQQIDNCDIRSPLERIQGKIMWLLEDMSLEEFIHSEPTTGGVLHGSINLPGQPRYH